MALYSSGIETIYYVDSNPNKEVTDLSVVSEPIYKFLDLTWSHPPSPGTYRVYWLLNGTWTYSGSSTTSTSITVDPPDGVVKVQLRTDNTYPSNIVTFSVATTPETRVLSTTARYDGVLLDWSPATLGSERVEVYRDNTVIFKGSASSYISSSGGAFKIRFYKGTGADVIYGTFSNTVTTSVLTPPAARVEPSAPAEFYLGVNRAGEQILHICNPSVVPALPPSVETGKAAVDWFQDWVGIDHDYGSDTYFHSKFSYVYCTSAVRITTYTDTSSNFSGYYRRFNFSDAITVLGGTSAPYTPSGNLMVVVLVDSAGARLASNPVLTRTIEQVSDNQRVVDNYSQGEWGFGDAAGYYGGETFIRTSQDVASIEIYEFNLSVSGRDLVYVSQTGVDNGIILDENTFEVAGNDFSSMMLSYAGTGVSGEYVDTMNLSDSILPMGGIVDGAGLYVGDSGADIMQVLGSSGGSGWTVEMETGSIKRDNKYWFNAGRGRTRIQYIGTDTSLETTGFRFTVPEHPVNGAGTGTVSESSVSTQKSLLLNSDLGRLSSVLGFTVTPTTWESDDTGWNELYTLEDKTVAGFSSFSSRVPIHKMKRSMKAGVTYNQAGDPYWTVWYELDATFYLRKITESLFILEFDYFYVSRDGSGGLEREFSIPGFSFSFLGLS